MLMRFWAGSGELMVSLRGCGGAGHPMRGGLSFSVGAPPAAVGGSWPLGGVSVHCSVIGVC